MKKKCWLWHKDRVGRQGGLTKKQEKCRKTSYLVIMQSVGLNSYPQSRWQPNEWCQCKSWAAATGALMMIASIWDLFSEVTNTSHTIPSPNLCSSHMRNPTTDIYWSGALAVFQIVRITRVAKYNKRHSQIWFMLSAQGGRREIRQEEIVTREWPQENQTH